jgi:hypothetical protein
VVLCEWVSGRRRPGAGENKKMVCLVCVVRGCECEVLCVAGGGGAWDGVVVVVEMTRHYLCGIIHVLIHMTFS